MTPKIIRLLLLTGVLSWAQTITPGFANDPIQPIPPAAGLNPEKVALGRLLFNDPDLSGDGVVSCAFCHPLDRYGQDGLESSLGVENSPTERNTPSVFNAVFNVAQFWDGRAATLEAQIDGPLTNPSEMNSSWKGVVETLQRDDTYTDLFDKLYGEISERTVKDAIATFERALVTPDSAFDKYLKGEKGALTSRQIEGYSLFRSRGCMDCHFGVGIGGGLYAKASVVSSRSDQGRFAVTGKEADRFVFKVPSLRNVAMTAPYFHDGSVPTLEEAVARMVSFQTGGESLPAEVAKMTDFLTTLTGPPPLALEE